MKANFVISGIALTLFSCNTICNVQAVPIKAKDDTVQFKSSKLPCYKVDEFNTAVKEVVSAIYSDEFEWVLNDHIKNKIGEGDHAGSWEGVSAKDVVANMRRELNGTFVDTYGGIKGLWLNIFFGNIAFDGSEDGPILLNRIPLKKRSSADIANTIAHETAHRIGLKHPHSDLDMAIAMKEPPYVIGTIIEGLIKQKSQH